MGLLLLPILLINIGLGYWTAVVARAKGYNFWVGFLMGYLFNLIALIVYAYLPVKDARHEEVDE